MRKTNALCAVYLSAAVGAGVGSTHTAVASVGGVVVLAVIVWLVKRQVAAAPAAGAVTHNAYTMQLNSREFISERAHGTDRMSVTGFEDEPVTEYAPAV